MKKIMSICNLITLFFFADIKVSSQIVLEWRLTNVIYSNTVPADAGSATGTVNFTLQIHTTSGIATNISQISTGYSYQSSKAMVPTNPGCSITQSTPANISISPTFAGKGFFYTTVYQCNNTNFTTGGQSFDRRAVGTIDNGLIDINTNWVDVFTVTLWTLSATKPQGGYCAINSGDGGAPGAFSTYSVSDDQANQFPVNSLTYAQPPFLGPPLPIILSDFTAICKNGSVLLKWQTLSEENSDRIEIERNITGTEWKKIGSLKAAGSSSDKKEYEFIDGSSGLNSSYRLRLVDRDDKTAYSRVVRARCASPVYDIDVYPVPARDNLNLVVSTENKSKATIYILDILGTVLYQFNKDLEKGTNNFNLTIDKLTSGIYLLKVDKSDVITTKKIIVVR